MRVSLAEQEVRVAFARWIGISGVTAEGKSAGWLGGCKTRVKCVGLDVVQALQNGGRWKQSAQQVNRVNDLVHRCSATAAVAASLPQLLTSCTRCISAAGFACQQALAASTSGVYGTIWKASCMPLRLGSHSRTSHTCCTGGAGLPCAGFPCNAAPVNALRMSPLLYC